MLQDVSPGVLVLKKDRVISMIYLTVFASERMKANCCSLNATAVGILHLILFFKSVKPINTLGFNHMKDISIETEKYGNPSIIFTFFYIIFFY